MRHMILDNVCSGNLVNSLSIYRFPCLEPWSKLSRIMEFLRTMVIYTWSKYPELTNTLYLLTKFENTFFITGGSSSGSPCHQTWKGAQSTIQKDGWLVVWNMNFIFPFHIWYGIMGCHPNPIDELHHFSRWVHCITKQNRLITIINH